MERQIKKRAKQKLYNFLLRVQFYADDYLSRYMARDINASRGYHQTHIIVFVIARGRNNKTLLIYVMYANKVAYCVTIP